VHEEVPGLPKSLNLTQVCHTVLRTCLDLLPAIRATILLEDEHGWRVYSLSPEGGFVKERLTGDPAVVLEELASGADTLELSRTGECFGWIAVEGGPFSRQTRKSLEKVVEDLPAWLLQIRKYRRARREAVKDGLTDLFNYRYFIDALEREMRRCQESLSLIVIDVDDFKKYNDHFGHLKGSKLLRQIATILRTSSSTGSLVAKYGGDEFAVILPDTPKEEAFLIAQSIRHRIERHDFPGETLSQPHRTLTVSGGIATYPIDAKDPFGLFDKADHAMYEAKRRGKNKIMYFS
jgi:diguanylate cyclase (GGDEF)-like protein